MFYTSLNDFIIKTIGFLFLVKYIGSGTIRRFDLGMFHCIYIIIRKKMWVVVILLLKIIPTHSPSSTLDFPEDIIMVNI